MKICLNIVFIVLIYSGCSCEKDDGRFTKTQIIRMAQKNVPSVKFKLGESLNDIIPCSDYGLSCVSVHRIEIHEIVMIAIEFKNYEDAIIVARELNQYYFHNWVFDDVVGEPILEKFVKRVYKATIPK